MKKFIVLGILLILCSCIGVNEQKNEPKEAIFEFLEYYNSGNWDAIKNSFPYYNVYNRTISFHEIGDEKYSKPHIRNIEYYGKFCIAEISSEFYEIPIDRYCLLFNNSEKYEVCGISDNRSELEERINYIEKILRDSYLLNEENLKIIEPENIILLGEDHRTKEMSDLEFEFLKFLNKNYGFKNVIVELLMKSDQYFVDQYLKTGDEGYIKKYKENGMQGYFNFLRNVYEYNKNLDEKIKVWCGDIDYSMPKEQLDFIMKYLVHNY